MRLSNWTRLVSCEARNPVTHRLMKMNPIAGANWERADGRASLVDILGESRRESVIGRYPSTAEECRATLIRD